MRLVAWLEFSTLVALKNLDRTRRLKLSDTSRT